MYLHEDSKAASDHGNVYGMHLYQENVHSHGQARLSRKLGLHVCW